MRKTCIFFIFLMTNIICIAVEATSIKNVQLLFHESDFVFSEDVSGTLLIKTKDISIYPEAGKPALSLISSEITLSKDLTPDIEIERGADINILIKN